MNLGKGFRSVLHWHDWEVPERLLFLFLVAVLFFVVGFVCLPGCQNPYPAIDCTRPARLLEAADFQTCMTGPWSTIWIQLGAAVKDDVACGQFNVLVLPRACEAFDFDGDGDVDLGDFARAQNGDED